MKKISVNSFFRRSVTNLRCSESEQLWSERFTSEHFAFSFCGEWRPCSPAQIFHLVSELQSKKTRSLDLSFPLFSQMCDIFLNLRWSSPFPLIFCLCLLSSRCGLRLTLAPLRRQVIRRKGHSLTLLNYIFNSSDRVIKKIALCSKVNLRVHETFKQVSSDMHLCFQSNCIKLNYDFLSFLSLYAEPWPVCIICL